MTQTFAQELPKKITKDNLAKSNTLFIELASKALKWDAPTEPIKIVGPFYVADVPRWLRRRVFAFQPHDLMARQCSY